MMATLEKDARRAAETIGFASLRLQALPDQRLDMMPFIELTKRIELVLDDIGPHVVYTHFPGDVNVDHGLVARAACRPYNRPELRRFAVFETPSSTEWAWPLNDASLNPNHFVDISATLEIKIAAMECMSRSCATTRIRARAARSGVGRLFGESQVGRRAAEPFRILRDLE
jgi:LmbE family N-acetylglucosaminyl deacetylase